MHGDAFAEHVLVTDLQPGRLAFKREVLWLVADHGMRVYDVALAHAHEAADDRVRYALTMWHYARGVAFANTGRVKLAQAELGAFEKAGASVPKDAILFVVPAHDVLKVARHMLAGELAFRRGSHDEALVQLREAVVADDALRYSEPSPWMQPARHALGTLLLEAGHVQEAEQTYRADLENYPENGWALRGLTECLERRGATAEAAKVRARFDTAWARADVQIRASCFCRRFD